MRVKTCNCKNLPTDGEVRYPCDQCDYKATEKGSLKKHIDAVHGDVRYSCDQCDYKSKWKDNLKKL